MVFPTTYPAETLCLTIKVKISVRTAPPQTIYIYIYYLYPPSNYPGLTQGETRQNKTHEQVHVAQREAAARDTFLLRMGKSNIGNSKCMQTYTHKA